MFLLSSFTINNIYMDNYNVVLNCMLSLYLLVLQNVQPLKL